LRGRRLTDERLAQLERELAEIKQRNLKVEADQAWEVSKFRIIIICAITYCVATALMYVIGAQRHFFGALVPTVGFFLSAQSLPTLKRWWIKSRYQNKR